MVVENSFLHLVAFRLHAADLSDADDSSDGVYGSHCALRRALHRSVTGLIQGPKILHHFVRHSSKKTTDNICPCRLFQRRTISETSSSRGCRSPSPPASSTSRAPAPARPASSERYSPTRVRAFAHVRGADFIICPRIELSLQKQGGNVKFNPIETHRILFCFQAILLLTR